MFQIEWSKNNLFQNRNEYTIENCISNSEELMFIEREEHCFECAKSCKLPFIIKLFFFNSKLSVI
jgi:hypothetical protein